MDRVFKGKFRLAEALNAAHGFERYRAAVESGDIAGPEDIDVRRSKCAACPSLVTARGSSWCGQPFEDHTRAPRPTCGCLVGAKIIVASEQCPQRQWMPVAPVELTIEQGG